MSKIEDPRLRKALEKMSGRPTAISLADLTQPDAPLVYVNRAFEAMTGYAAQDVLGRNCRFLQGPGTDHDTVARIRITVETGTESAYCLLNYTRDGAPFHNLLMLAPLRLPSGQDYMIGCQYKIRPSVLARTLDAHIGDVQGVVGEMDGALSLPPTIWASFRSRSEGIRLVVDAYMLTVDQTE